MPRLINIALIGLVLTIVTPLFLAVYVAYVRSDLGKCRFFLALPLSMLFLF